MKSKFILVFIICILIISGCSNSVSNYSNTYDFNTDNQYNYSSCDFGGICETKNGYCFLSGPNFCFLYYFDKVKKQALPLCNKPNCLHADEPDGYKISECNAFLGLGTKYLGYYNDSIYCVFSEFENHESFYSLYRISLDGIKHRRILKFREEPQKIILHRGFLYYSLVSESIIEENEGNSELLESSYKLVRICLDKPQAEPEVLEEGRQIYGGIGPNIICYGNDIYYSVSYFTDASLLNQYNCIMKYNIKTKEKSVFIENGTYPGTIFNNHLIYGTIDGVYACDFNGNSIIRIFDQKGGCYANNDFLFINSLSSDNEYVFTIIDRSWNVTTKKNMDGFSVFPVSLPIGCSDEFYFIYKYDLLNEYGGCSSLYGIPVNTVREEMNPILLYEFVPKVPFTGVSSITE